MGFSLAELLSAFRDLICPVPYQQGLQTLGTMWVRDSNPRYLAELNGSRVYCDDMASAEAHLDYWSKELLHCWGRR